MKLLFLILGLSVVFQAVLSYNGRCVIFGEHVYLYETFWKTPSVWNARKYNLFALEKYEFSSINGDTSGQWNLEPVSDRKDTYYLINVKYNNYLASDDKAPIDFGFYRSEQRKVLMKDKIDLLDESCMWKLSPRGKNYFIILNVKNNEPLTMHIYKGKSVSVNLYTLHKPRQSKFFEWQLECIPEFKNQ